VKREFSASISLWSCSLSLGVMVPAFPADAGISLSSTRNRAEAVVSALVTVLPETMTPFTVIVASPGYASGSAGTGTS